MDTHEDGRIARGTRHREAIVDAANALIRERGSATLTADEIATRAGVSRRTVFNHFGSVDDIVTAACTRELAAAVDAMQEASARSARRGASSAPAFDALAHIFLTLDLTPTVSYLAVVLEPHGVRSTARHRFDEIFWEAGDLLASVAIKHSPQDPFHVDVLVRAVIGAITACIDHWLERNGAAVSEVGTELWFTLVDEALACIDPRARTPRRRAALIVRALNPP